MLLRRAALPYAVVIVGLFFFIVVGIVVWQVVKFAQKYSRATKDAWLWAAQELGLRFEEGSVFSGGKISGIMGSTLVVVDTYTQRSGNSSSTYTRYEVRYPQSLGLGMKLTKQGAMSGVAKMFGAQDEEIGQKTFDDTVVVKVDDLRQFRRYLTSERRRTMVDAFLRWPNLKIEDDALRASTSGTERDPGKLVRTVRDLVELARVVSHDRAAPAGRLSEPPPMPSMSPPPPPPDRALPPPLAGSRPPAPNVEEIPPPRERVPEPEPEPVPGPAAGELALATVCAELYRPGQSGSEAEALFEASYRGKTVRVEGTLRSAQRYSFDIVFGDTPAMRAMVDVYQEASSGFGSRTVQAVARFPEEMRDRLNALSSQEVAFTGSLIKFDRLLRKLYVAGCSFGGGE